MEARKRRNGQNYDPNGQNDQHDENFENFENDENDENLLRNSHLYKDAEILPPRDEMGKRKDAVKIAIGGKTPTELVPQRGTLGLGSKSGQNDSRLDQILSQNAEKDQNFQKFQKIEKFN